MNVGLHTYIGVYICVHFFRRNSVSLDVNRIATVAASVVQGYKSRDISKTGRLEFPRSLGQGVCVAAT